jgi:hypothetical protein
MDYQCDWYAPVLAEPNSMVDVFSKDLLVTIEGVQCRSISPLEGNCVYASVMFA